MSYPQREIHAQLMYCSDNLYFKVLTAQTYLQWYEKIRHFSKIKCAVCCTTFLFNYEEPLVTVAQIFYNLTNSRGTGICPQLFNISCAKNYRDYSSL